MHTKIVITLYTVQKSMKAHNTRTNTNVYKKGKMENVKNGNLL